MKSNFICVGLLVLSSCLSITTADDKEKDKRLFMNIGGGGGFQFLFAPPPNPPPPPPPAVIVPVPGPPPSNRAVMYKKFEGAVDKQGAINLCAKNGGRLAKIYNQKEQAAVLSLKLTANGYYFDLTRVGANNYRFSDNSEPQERIFGINQPDGSGECMQLWQNIQYKWDDIPCTMVMGGAVCEFDAVGADCSCSASGDPHFKLFDGQWIHFYGICKYTLAKYSGDQTCSFDVEIKNERRFGNPGPSYVRLVDVKIFGKVFRLHQGRALFVDGVQTKGGYNDGNKAQVIYGGNKVTFLSQQCGLTVTYDGVAMVTVTTTGKYRNQLSGMCGNCDGISNDYRTKDGKDVSSDPQKYNLVGNSWVTKDDSDIPLASCQPPEPVPENPCRSAQDLTAILGSKFCGIENGPQGAFQTCVKSGQVSVQDWKASCQADLCFNVNDPIVLNKVKCQIIQSFVDLCNQKGITGIVWREFYNCPMTCGNNQVYSSNTSPCPLTCADVKNGITTRTCPTLPTTEGCQCNNGFVVDGPNCVPKDNCKPSYKPPNYDAQCLNIVGNNAWQDSLDWGGLPQRGADGNKAQNWGSNTCTHTLAGSSHWWAVSFDTQYSFNNVRITNRQDCCSERLNDIKVYVSNQPIFDPANPLDGATECMSYHTDGAPPSVLNLWSDTPCTGYFGIVSQVRPGGILTLCEVEFCTKTKPVETTYVKFDIQIDYNGANVYCKNRGGRLAKIKTDPIYKAVLGLGLTSFGYWFDLKTTTPKGQFTCSDGSQPSISPWGPTQPDGNGLCGWLWRTINYKWDDTGCNTQAGCICEFDKPYTEPPPCTCTGSGDPHFQLFDGQWVHYYGICKYTMVKYSGDSTCAYSVEVKLERRNGNPGPSYIRQADVKIFGKTFRLHLGRKLFVDGKQVASYDDGATARVFLSGTFLVFKSQICDLTVQWDGVHMVKVTTAGRFGDKLNGICGNCDHKKNDYVTKDGADVSGKPNVYNLIGDSYAVPDDSDAPTASCKPAEPVPPQICAKKEDLTMIQGPLYCGVDSSSSGKIQECVKSGRVAVQDWQASCIADLCFNAGDPVVLNKVKCDSLKAFVDLCAQNGFTGIAWRDIYKCPYTCGNNMVYSPAVNPCPLTCADLRNGITARDCPDLQSTEGCQCNDGFALDKTNCIPVDQCKPGPVPTRPPVDSQCLNIIGNNAWQDSVDFGGNPQRAVDGNKNQGYSANSCSHTTFGPSHWWAVSFDAQYTFNNVRIWNRIDCCTERLNNFKVYTSNVPFFDPSNPLDGAVECLSYSTSGSPPQFFDLWSDSPCTGSFLIISMVNNGQPITLCEVEVCNKDKPKQTNYVKFDVQVTGDNAVTFCANKGGRLAQVYTESDHKAVKALGLTGSGYYFALVTKAGNTYQYPDGTKPTYYPWGKNALDQSGTCSQYWSGVSYDWDDVDCSLKLGAICEFTKPYTEPPPCSCSAAGDPHFQLFDGQWIHYYGICKYTLAKYDGDTNCKFDVEIKNERRFNNPGPSYVRLVDIKIFGKVFRLHQARQLLVDGKSIKTYDDGWNARVFISGTNLVFQSDKCGITVSFDGNSVATVKLEGRYGGKVNGMCGNCDRKQNDYVTKDGTNVAGKPDVYNLIGDSWQVKDDSDAPVAQCLPADPPPPEACPDPTTKANVEGPKACGVETGAPGKLMDCVKSGLINIDQWKASCVADLCFNANDQVTMNRVKCDIIKALVDLCTQKGFTGIDWRTTYNCPLPCGNNMEYSISTNPCPVTCTDLRNGVTSRSCPDLPQVEGCQCKQGFVLDQRNCVPNDQCKPGPVPTPPPQDPQCINVYGNDVWQDSLGFEGVPQRAIDGNANQDYSAKSCSHTGDAGKHWWVVSFDGLYTFNNVRIFNRKDCCTERLNNFKVMTSQLPIFDPSNPFNGMNECYAYSTTGTVPTDFDIPISKTCTGTYAMIYLDNNNTPLTLCEVKFCNKPLPTPPPGIPPPPSTIARVPRLTPCSCSAVGDPHIKTFDGAFVHHFGTCKYTLAAYNGGPSDPCNFNVETKNENRFGNTGPSYVRLVDVKMFGKTYRLHQDRKLFINGKETAVPYSDANVNIDSISGLLTFRSDKCDVTVSFNGVANAFVDVGGKYAYLLTGICGNCDSIQNEYRTKDGKDVSSDKNKNNLVGDSWQVPDDSDVPSATCNPAPVIPDTPCATAAQKEIVSASNICGFDKVDDPGIAACFKSPKIKLDEFRKSCEMDYCLNMKSEQIDTIRCEIISGVIDECYKAGFVDLSWRAYYDCSMDCGYDREYQTMVNPCPVTCKDAANGITTKSCPNAVKRDGCVCFEGYYPEGDECKETFLCDKSAAKK